MVPKINKNTKYNAINQSVRIDEIDERKSQTSWSKLAKRV